MTLNLIIANNFKSLCAFSKIFEKFIMCHYRSQLSICSEPMASIKQLSCQSSIDPCVVEEEIPVKHERATDIDTIQSHAVNKSRPDSLILTTTTIKDTTSDDVKKYLYRSQSTRSFKKPKLKASKVLSDLDQIYVISSNACTRSDLNEFYDSIEVITERRSKNFMEFSEENGDKSSELTKKHSKSNEIIVEIESHNEK